MQFWLTDFNNTKQVLLQLPVNPESFSISKGVTINSVNIANIGEVGIFGKGNLATFSISTFFPNQEYPFVNTKTLKDPYEYVSQVDSMMVAGKQIRFIVTGTPVNIPVYIESFEYGERDGTGDVYYTIGFKEYKRLTTTLNSSAKSKAPVKKTVKRPVEKPPVKGKVYVVKAGDTMSKISKKVYGDSSKYKELAKKNKISSPYNIVPNQKLVF